MTTTVIAERLVIFAGPRKTSETSVEEFFFSYAHGPGSASIQFPHQQALKHWIWPQIHSVTGLTTTPHQIFRHLVTDADNVDMQRSLLSELRSQYDKAKEADGDDFQGMIIGSEDFDRVGPNPYSDDDAVAAVSRVVQELGLSPSSVTIVLLYRLPRLQQWLGIFNFIPFEDEDGEYQQFLCNDDYIQNYAWDALQNSMNPLRVAQVYANQGYDVRALDMAGIVARGMDVEHVIGCTVLNAECDENGYLINLSDESYLKDSEVDDSMLTEFPELTLQQEADLETLFQLRDCTYDSLRTDPTSGISLEFQQGMLTNECSESEKSMATLLIDTDYFLNVIQAQVDCNPVPVSIKAIFDGTATVETTPATNSPTLSPTVGTSVEGTDLSTPSPTSSMQPPIEEPEAIELSGTVTLPEAGEPNENENVDAQSKASNASSGGDPKWRMPVFFFIFIGVGGAALLWKRRSRRRQRNVMESQDQELQPSLVEPTQDWTKTFD